MGMWGDCNKLVDILGFAPTNLADRLFLKEINLKVLFVNCNY